MERRRHRRSRDARAPLRVDTVHGRWPAGFGHDAGLAPVPAALA
ncbi:hypothetical protein [uncultured Jannaschia sp.]|nr:hypothetical protein [uncultured Jannaschia sp.]